MTVSYMYNTCSIYIPHISFMCHICITAVSYVCHICDIFVSYVRIQYVFRMCHICMYHICVIVVSYRYHMCIIFVSYLCTIDMSHMYIYIYTYINNYTYHICIIYVSPFVSWMHDMYLQDATSMWKTRVWTISMVCFFTHDLLYDSFAWDKQAPGWGGYWWLDFSPNNTAP